jgi:hypothetical protein
VVMGFIGEIWWGLFWYLKDGAESLEVDLTDAVLSSGSKLSLRTSLRL